MSHTLLLIIPPQLLGQLTSGSASAENERTRGIETGVAGWGGAAGVEQPGAAEPPPRHCLKSSRGVSSSGFVVPAACVCPTGGLARDVGLGAPPSCSADPSPC